MGAPEAEPTTQRDGTPSPATPPSDRVSALGALERPVRHAERRMRLRRALVWAARAMSVGLVVALAILVLRKTGVVGERTARVVLAAAVVQFVVAAVVGYVRRLAPRAGAVALDRFHGLSDRLSSALSFAELAPADRTPFMEAAIDDALAHVDRVDPKRAVRIGVPAEWPFVLAMASSLAVVAAFELRTRTVVSAAKTIDAVDVTADDLDAMREFLRDVEQRMESDDAKAATQEFNQLIEDLANRRLDRTEAFRRMQQLEDKLLEGREVDAKSLEEALRQMAEELRKSDMSKPAGEALANQNLADAEKAMRELAKKLREQGSKIDKAQLDKLRDALKKAGENQKQRADALDARREELKSQLLKQRQQANDAGAEDEEKRLLQKRERELERLDRQSEEQKKAQRELDRLDRDLQKAAEDLAKDLGLSAQDLDGAAEDINRMAREQMSQEEKEQLRQKLEELRENLRQQAQGGQNRVARLRTFQQRARGQSGSQGKSGSQGQGGEQGQGQEGQGDPQSGDGQAQNGQGQNGQGQQGQGQKGQGGQGQQGQGGQGSQGQGQGAGDTWILGPNGERMMMLSAGKGSGSQSGGSQGGGSGGEGNEPGRGVGTGHDPKVQGGATRPNVGTQDTQVAGNDTGQGGSRSEVILGAAERGFASRGYQRVFREYHTVAEEALDKDEIPGGYRFYVRRYFQLIRPRDGATNDAPPAPTNAPDRGAP